MGADLLSAAGVELGNQALDQTPEDYRNPAAVVRAEPGHGRSAIIAQAMAGLIIEGPSVARTKQGPDVIVILAYKKQDVCLHADTHGRLSTASFIKDGRR